MDEQELRELQRERFPLATKRAEGKARKVKPGTHTEGLLRAAGVAKTPRKRLAWLHRAASAWAAPLEHFSACRKGCAHCCHIPTLILSTEAKLLSEVTGRPMASPGEGRKILVYDAMTGPGERPGLQSDRYRGVPCPFVVEGACSVYEHRPIICRVHLNLDDDDLLCRLVSVEDEPSVPYANNVEILAACIGQMPGDDLADIRDFFL